MNPVAARSPKSSGRMLRGLRVGAAAGWLLGVPLLTATQPAAGDLEPYACPDGSFQAQVPAVKGYFVLSYRAPESVEARYRPLFERVVNSFREGKAR